MTGQAELIRIESDLQEAQAEIQTAATVEGSLVDSLKFGFGALFAAVHALTKGFGQHGRRIDEHDRQLKIAISRISELESSVHGLRVSRGKAVAAKNRALAIIVNAKSTLDNISLN
jgi:hypothetical protein